MSHQHGSYNPGTLILSSIHSFTGIECVLRTCEHLDKKTDNLKLSGGGARSVRLWKPLFSKPLRSVSLCFKVLCECIYSIIVSAEKVFMALTCVNNHLGDHACTSYYTHYLCYSRQRYNVPTITVYCGSKHGYKQLSLLLYFSIHRKLSHLWCFRDV